MNHQHPNLNPAKRDDWGTPPPLFEALHDEFAFTVDGAASAENALLPCYWDKEHSALEQDWRGHTVYINPPFDHKALAAFARKAWHETRQLNTNAVMLCPVKSDQRWWGEYAIRSQIRFLRGRVKFAGADSALPVPCALLVFGIDCGPEMVQVEIPR
jgi:site-specific DNA-methyltransferase (adenine-specific)